MGQSPRKKSSNPQSPESDYFRAVTASKYPLWKKGGPILGQLDMELTERCNNACVHCLINRPKNDAVARSGEMDAALVKNLLRQASELGCLAVRFTGGEPLLREDFAELYLFARRLGIKVILFTNARLISKELADLFARIPPGQPIEVSAYGMTAASYDAVAGAKGAFQEFQRGVDRLHQSAIPFILKWAILPPNRDEYVQFQAWAAAISSENDVPAASMMFDLRARRDDPAKNRRIRALRCSPEEAVLFMERDPRYLPGVRRLCAHFVRPLGDRLFPCGERQVGFIDSSGNAQVCQQLRHPDTIYDLRSAGTLRFALTQFFPALRELKATDPEYLRRCARCFLMGLCEQCPGKSWMEHGTLDKPVEYLCSIAHAQAKHLGLLKNDENAWDVGNGKERIARLLSNQALR